jgi:NodT family efflux transporter outer membrane factor (OMF) lipoprotein
MKRVVLTTVLIALGGCSMMPSYERPAISFGNSWGDLGGSGNSAAESGAISANWWTALGSDELNSFIGQSLTNNNDLLAAVARIAEARGSLRQAGASLLPSVSAGYDSTYSKPDTSRKGGGDSAVSGGVSYELDLFGANRSSRSAAKAQLEAAGYDRESLALTTASDVAQGYINLLATRERIALAETNLEVSRRILALLEIRLKVGTVGLLEVTQQRTAVAQSEASLASLRETEATYRTALAILVGVAPQDLRITATSLAGLVPLTVPVDMPATVLERRPDLKAAEANIKAANGDIGAARAAFFPTTTLSAGLTQSIDPVVTGVNLGAAVLAPIFNGGANIGALQTANARQQEVAATYRQAVLTAFGEVGNALAAQASARTRVASLQVGADSAAKGLELAQLQLKAGTTDLPTLLNTQASDVSAKDALVQARAADLAGGVQLVRVMGGAAE